VEGTDEWWCHSCRAKNLPSVDHCSVCGRHESFAQGDLPFPLHGETALLFRPSQVINVLQNVHEVDSVKWTPLHTACSNRNVPMVHELLRLGSVVDALTEKGQTPLHLAVYAGCTESCQALLSKRAKVNIPTIHEKNTALHLACDGGWRKIVHLLIGEYPFIVSGSCDARRSLPLNTAVIHYNVDVYTQNMVPM
jgi:ankyrin repeat protein